MEDGMKNKELAVIFSTMADILDFQGANRYRVLAYRRAAESVAALGQPIEDVWRAGDLETISGVGETLAAKIDEWMRTGQIEAYEKLRAAVPLGVVEMLEIPDVGPKRARLFWEELGLTDVDALERAARQGQLRQISGMGAKRERNVLHGIELWRRRTDRTLLNAALPLARRILEALREVPGVVEGATAGSLRRRRETVGDLDLLVAAQDAAPVMARFRSLPQTAEVLLSGATKTSIRTPDGFQVDLRVLEPARWGTGLQYFTGSQAHNVHLRQLALDRGLSLSEYALTREDGTEILCATEEAVYAALGLPLIPPELREDRGEIEAALEGRLPRLVTVADLRGDFQFHTTWSDGHQSLAQMAEAAREQGLAYALVTDHSESLGVARGLSVEDVRRQRAELEALNERLAPDFRLLAGTEVEIRADGSLDFPDEVLAELDLVVAALHSGLRQGRERATARMLAAIRNPHVDVIAHPTGRLIGERAPADLDMEAVFRAAAETGTALEVNANPRRLDLRDVYVKRAIELGVKLAISSDAHSVDGFGLLPFGVAVARRGWAQAEDVVNTWPWERVLAWAAR
jgi:DNA polymerase (family 10)